MIYKDDASTFSDYLTDVSNIKGTAQGIYFPESVQEAQNIIKKAYRTSTPVTISGAGTGICGGRVPEGGIIIATDKLNTISEFSTDDKTITVGPGIRLSEIQEFLQPTGLFYPPDPTETSAFLGGTIATNASGARSFFYGPTRNYISSLTVITPTGELLKINRSENYLFNNQFVIQTEQGGVIRIPKPNYTWSFPKNSAGIFPAQHPIDLFIGSEGTLGMVVSATVQLLQQPKTVFSGLINFPTPNSAIACIAALREKKYPTLSPCALEFFDTNSLKLLSSKYKNITTEGCALWFEEDSYLESDSVFDKLAEGYLNLFEQYGAESKTFRVATNEAERREFQEIRHSISYLVNEFISQQGLRKLGTDTAVPHNTFLEFYNKSTEIVLSANLRYVAYGHFGDSHLHLNLLPEGENEYGQAADLYDQINKLALSFGGTIAAEHGVGKKKKHYLPLMFSRETLQDMQSIKKVLDPAHLFGQNNLFPSS